MDMRLDDAPQEGERIRIDGVVYVVKRVHYDGAGSCTLDLDSPHLDDDPSISDGPHP